MAASHLKRALTSRPHAPAADRPVGRARARGPPLVRADPGPQVSDGQKETRGPWAARFTLNSPLSVAAAASVRHPAP
jgi:hypothetical protein